MRIVPADLLKQKTRNKDLADRNEGKLNQKYTTNYKRVLTFRILQKGKPGLKSKVTVPPQFDDLILDLRTGRIVIKKDEEVSEFRDEYDDLCNKITEGTKETLMETIKSKGWKYIKFEEIPSDNF